jgi:two-component system OmpR family response regulator
VSTTVRVLVVDDDTALAARVVGYLESHGLSATAVASLSDARQLLRAHSFDVVMLDLTLPGENGLDLLHELVAARGVPVVVASALGEEAERVLALESGAADYLVKPFSFRELLARLRNAVRHDPRRLQPRQAARRIAHVGPWRIEPQAHLAVDGTADRRVAFTSGEMLLLVAFLEHPGSVLTRQELLALTRHDDSAVFLRTIDVLVARVRQKLDADPARPSVLQTVRGQGYRFDAPVTWDVVSS